MWISKEKYEALERRLYRLETTANEHEGLLAIVDKSCDKLYLRTAFKSLLDYLEVDIRTYHQEAKGVVVLKRHELKSPQ